MSLHKFADMVAQQGRGDDSLLIHMTPDEVQRLQQFAQANGRSLTINPTTGLPEAGMLSDLFKAIAPIALGAFLGPAGFGMSSMMAGVATGGITALATGSLSRGLMAGLGAYGGAGLGESLMGAGGNALVAGGAPIGAENIAGPAVPPIEQVNPSNYNLSNADKFSAGVKAVTASPTAALDFAKSNLSNLSAAAAPIMAGAMVPTTTKLPTPTNNNYIRQFDYNINPDTGKPDPLYGMRAMTPVKASEFGNKTFQGQRDAFRQQNPNPYELGVSSLNQPPQPQQPAQMNTGGIVALAGGDVKHYAIGRLVEGGPLTGGAGLDMNNDIYKYFSDPATQALLSSGNDAAIAAKMQEKDWTAAQIAAATGTQNKQADYERRFAQAVATPTTDASEFLAATKDVGLQNQGLATALQNSGMSAADQYALTHNLNDAAGALDASGKPIDFYNKIGYTAGALPGDQGGLEGLYANINYSAKGLQDQINAGTLSVADAQALARGEMGRVGVNDKDIKSATGKDFASLFTPKTVVTPPPDPFVSVTPGEVKLPTATTYDNGAFGNYGSGNKTGVDSNGKTVSIATPGDIITNPDGTRTVVPNVPGRPYGGFTGMDPVKSAYTAGGGSLGYTAKAPKTIDEFNQLYNKQTGDSLAAYNYLMGKGANNNAYPVKSGVAKVAVPYNEYVLGKKTASTKPVTTDKGTTVIGVPGNPQSYFDEKAYLAAHPDVQAELTTGKSVSGKPVQFSSGYEHWLKYGQPAGWAFSGDYAGYKTAAALATSGGATGAGGGPGGTTANSANTVSDSNTANSITGLAAPANNSISVSDAVASPADSATTSASTGNSIGAGQGDGDGDGDGGVGDARGGYYSRGKLNYGSKNMAMGGYALGGLGSLGSYSDGGRLLKGPGDGVSDSIPATIGAKSQPARLADGEFVVPARIVSELGNGSTDAGAKKLYAMMDRVQSARGKTTGKNKVAANSRSDKYLPA